MTYKTQKKLLLISFLLIPLALMGLLFLFPFFRLFYMSFTDWDGIMPQYNFVGIDNYMEVFQTPDVWIALRNNVIYILNGVLQNIIALFFAVLLTAKIRGRNFYKASIFLPFIINSAAVAFMFTFLFDFERGPVNALLANLGAQPVSFLGDVNIVNFSLAGISLWRYTGYTMILYIAAFQSINPDIYESAMIDGAGTWQNFIYITLPSIKTIIELNMFLTLSGGLQAFVEPFVVTKGGPVNASSTFVLYTINAFTQFNRYGFAAALSVVLLVIVLILAAIQKKFIFKGD
ncbi:MAG: sugar transporter permease [Eubacterium sp.]|jgi:multiple sugar transport system permease protein|nr:sugar transporter permease [Eubacterium sp.]